jgi:hypothetical protein
MATSILNMENNLNPHLIPYKKTNSKWVTDLNIKARIIKLLEEKQEKIFITLVAEESLVKI